MSRNELEIRAVYDENTITVYQAYKKEIALPAVKAQTFVNPFKMGRMTWIKPSFLWMMYRSGWVTKEGQEHILSIKIKREGFDWALANSCLSTYNASKYDSFENWQLAMKESSVRIQWDPEKDIHLNNLPYRSIQIGVKGIALEKYVHEWIISIEDISDYCKNIHQLIIGGKLEEAKEKLPKERIYLTE